MKLFSWLLLLLIIFFTFLTGYALFSGKIKTCGCFGDCIPLSPAQSFGKDLLLLVLIGFLMVSLKHIQSLLKPVTAFVLLFGVVILVSVAQFYVLRHLPFIDCLPYKKGNNILAEMKMPAGAIPDSFAIVFTYKKGGKDISFDQEHFPADFDSTFEYVGRKDQVVKKGNGLQPKIVDFSLQGLNGADTTAAVFAQSGTYLMVLAKDFQNYNDWEAAFDQIRLHCAKFHFPVILVTADAAGATTLLKNAVIAKCDATVIKTAARVTPTFFLMQGAQIKEKYGYLDANKLENLIGHYPYF
jgi:predicted membrane channel-forming protein YqfA (hemolysin III family)